MLRWKSSLKPAAAVATDYRSTILADSPLFYYRLGEASGTTAYDEVAASSNGTYSNTPSLGQTGAISGDSNTSVLFEQANSEYAETLTLSSETSLLPCTIELFIKPSGASGSNAGIVFYRSGSTSASGLNIKGSTLGKLGYSWRDQANTYGYSSGPTLSDNTWYYVALVVESTKATFYVIEADGTLTTAVNSVSHSALDCSNDGWYFARDSGYTNRDFQGYLDEVAIYDQALSQSTVVAHAAAAGFTSSGTSYLLEERFEESDSGGALGSSTDGYDSTLVSSEVPSSGSTIDPDESTLRVLGGSQSLEVNNVTSSSYVEFDLGTDYDELWFHCSINRGTGSVANRIVLKFFDQAGTASDTLRGDGSNKARVAGVSSADGFTYADNSAVDHFWMHWIKNSTSTFYWGKNTSTRPTSGGNVVSFTAANVSIGKFQIGIFSRNGNYRYDDILISTSEIGDNP